MREVSIFCLGTSYYMFFKGILFAARAGKAHGLLLRQKYNESFRVLKKLLDSEPEKYLLPNIYENLGLLSIIEAITSLLFIIWNCVWNRFGIIVVVWIT